MPEHDPYAKLDSIEALSAFKDLNALDQHGKTPFYIVCGRCSAELIDAALKRNADPLRTTKSGKQPIYAAAKAGNAEAVTLLLKAGADPDAANKLGYTALWLACHANRCGVVTALLEGGADANLMEQRSGTTPLVVALSQGHIEASLAMVAFDGTNIEVQDGVGCSPLWVACSEGLVEVVDALIARGADVNKVNQHRRSPLHAAALQGHQEICEKLLAADADASMTDENGEGPIYAAATNGYVGVLAVIKNSASGRVWTEAEEQTLDGETPLITAAWHGHLKCVHFLTQNVGNIEKPNLGGKTALIAACWRGHPLVAELLLTNGANISKVDEHGRTALWAACRGGNADCVAVCMRKGGDPDQMDNRQGWSEAGAGVASCTPLFAACWQGHYKVVKTMLELGADPDLGDVDGRSCSEVTDNEDIKNLIAEYIDMKKHGNLPPPAPGKGQFAASKQQNQRQKQIAADIRAQEVKKEQARQIVAKLRQEVDIGEKKLADKEKDAQELRKKAAACQDENAKKLLLDQAAQLTRPEEGALANARKKLSEGVAAIEKAEKAVLDLLAEQEDGGDVKAQMRFRKASRLMRISMSLNKK